MKTILSMSSGAALAPTLLLLAPAAFAAPVPIPDKNLETAIRAALHEPSSELNEDKLNNLFVLEAPGKEGKQIKDVTGLEKCKNLALLKLTNNQIADLK